MRLKVRTFTGHHSVSELSGRPVEQGRSFSALLIRFVLICNFWLNREHVLAPAHQGNFGVIFLQSSCGQLLRLRTGVRYAAGYRLHAYILQDLINPETVSRRGPRIIVKTTIVKSMVGPAFCAAGVASSRVKKQAEFAIYPLSPLFYVMLRKRHDSRCDTSEERSISEIRRYPQNTSKNEIDAPFSRR